MALVLGLDEAPKSVVDRINDRTTKKRILSRSVMRVTNHLLPGKKLELHWGVRGGGQIDHGFCAQNRLIFRWYGRVAIGGNAKFA